jgi:hypothetical protein
MEANMKLLYFIQWWWKKLDTWQKIWICSCFFLGAGIAEDGPYKHYLLAVPLIVVLLSMLKWVFWDGIKNSWLEYNKEQDHLIKIMKDSK